jgi:uncharacterized coiled-coil protein SlyX
MTTLKIQGKPAAAAQQGLEPYVTRFYDSQGIRAMAIVELQHVERSQPAPGSDKSPTVVMRISALEVATIASENLIREAQRALYLMRTAAGTIDENGDFALGEDTVKRLSGQIAEAEAARMHAGIHHWAAYAGRLEEDLKLTVAELRHELGLIATSLRALTDGLA